MARAWDARNPVPTAPIKSRRPSTDHAIGILVDVDQIRAITATQAVGKITERAFLHDRHYATSEQPDGVFCVYARA